MSDQTIHPDPTRLGAFARGELELDEIDEIQKHLAACDSCCRAVAEVPDDELLELVRQAGNRNERVQRPKSLGARGGTAETAFASQDQTNDEASLPIGSRADKGDTFHCQQASVLPSELAEHSRYRVLEQIGKGGMGDVYKAEHRLMERTVALKVISQNLVDNKQAVERFRREVRAAASLSHPNIVSAFDAEQAGGVHFLVMEYVEGTNLADVVKERGQLAIDEACEFIRQAAVGLQHAHELGMIHRDIKPHNLMLTNDDKVKILDFGLASLTTGSAIRDQRAPQRSDLTTLDMIIGTPDYISPEQAADAREADIRSDIYSLGATLYFLLTGHPPFAKGTVMQKLADHASSEPELIETVRVDVPAELASVLRCMMAKEPEARFGTPAEVADALAPFVDRHRSPPVRAPKPLHQHTEPAPYSPQRREASLGGIGLVIGVCVVVLFLVVGGLGAYFVLMTDDGTRLGSARPTPEKSSFYSSASDLKALVERCKPETGLTIKSITGPWGSSGGRGRDLRHDRGILCTVDGDWKAVAGFLLSLKEELERTARANGAVISAIPQGRRNGDLTSFKLEYSMGDAHGRVEANIENTPANPDIAQLDNARIRITIEEWVRPSTR